MSDSEKDGGSSIGASPLQIIVKGGTTSAAYDKQRAEQKHMAELGRAHQDKQIAASSAGPRMTREGFVASQLTSLRLSDSGSPQLVLYYKNRDKTTRQECVANLVMVGSDPAFVMVCPKCLERGEPQGSSQMIV